jgi:hypothetical protein
MHLKYGLISVDDHIQEPPSLWTDRLSKNRFGDRVPHLERAVDGTERWMVDGQALLNGYPAIDMATDAGNHHSLFPRRFGGDAGEVAVEKRGEPIPALTRIGSKA